MNYSPLAIKRSNVLGEIYNQCDAIESIPVYLNEQSGELLGFVNEEMGRYADVFTFHLSEEICKQLSSNQFDFAFDFDYSEKTNQSVNKKRIKLNHILLVQSKNLPFVKKSVSKLAT